MFSLLTQNSHSNITQDGKNKEYAAHNVCAASVIKGSQVKRVDENNLN